MKIETNRVAAYLAGNFPPYYEEYDKIEFILILSGRSPKIFSQEKFNLIEKHTDSLQKFYASALNILKNEERLLVEIIEELNIPFEARGSDFVQSKVKENKIEDITKDIGFITPFDDEKEEMEEVVSNILNDDFPEYSLTACSLKEDGDGKILWNSIKDFSEKYDLYIVDFRDKNLNVAIELGYILALEKPFILIVSEDLPSDINGFIYVKKEQVNVSAINGDITDDQKKELKEKSEKFQNNLKEKLDRFLT
ncbi:hypothetical protein COB57_04790 [Candidatus Peregrinibacteria bacterium]|nr:MAG: hypothetical protein COB57_04790 [Candidatus Peregrinibacteria bacterium]